VGRKTTMEKQNWEFNRNVLFNVFVCIAILSRFFSHESIDASPYNKAYLDPGTGSMIISAIIGVFATIVLGFKTIGYKIKNLFQSKPKQTDEIIDSGRREKS
jgi:hypothetical protein